MDELIEALQIIRSRTSNRRKPTNCEHGQIVVLVDDVRAYTKEEKKRLDELGFFLSEGLDVEMPDDVEWYDWDLSVLEDDDFEFHGFMSYRFGSA